MRDIQRYTLPVCVALLSYAAPQPSTAAYQFYMDSFVIAKAFPNDTTDPLVAFSDPYIKFLDEFDAGGAPPDLTGVFNSDQNTSGTPDFSYSSNPATDGTVGPEVAYQDAQDLLSLSSGNAVVYAGAGGQPQPAPVCGGQRRRRHWLGENGSLRGGGGVPVDRAGPQPELWHTASGPAQRCAR